MKRCSGNNTQDWGFDSVFEIQCPECGNMVEFFIDDIDRRCSKCGNRVESDRKNAACGQWCSSSSPHFRSRCSKFKRSKDRFYKGF